MSESTNKMTTGLSQAYVMYDKKSFSVLRRSWSDGVTTQAVLEYCTEELVTLGGREIGRQ